MNELTYQRARQEAYYKAYYEFILSFLRSAYNFEKCKHIEEYLDKEYHYKHYISPFLITHLYKFYNFDLISFLIIESKGYGVLGFWGFGVLGAKIVA